MKPIFLLFFFFACAILTAQQVDTSYVSLRYGYNADTQDSVYYETKTVVFTDGRTNVTESIIGNDTTTVIAYLTDQADRAAEAYAAAANEVWQRDKVISFILNANTVLSNFSGVSIVQESVTRYGAAVDSTTWDVSSTEIGDVTGTLTVNPNGNNLRMQIGGTTYTLLPVGDSWIRFQNIPSGSFTDLHRVENTPTLTFKSADETLTITRQ